MTASKSAGDRGRPAANPPIDLVSCVSGLVLAVDGGMATELAPDRLTPMEFRLLRHCREERECTATHLAQALPVDGSRISRIVTGLVDRGLLRRRRLRNDRRIVMLRLSEEGAELTGRVIERVERYDARLLAGLGAEEMRVFTDVTARIVANHAASREAG